MNAMNMHTPQATDMQITLVYPICKLGAVVSTVLDNMAQIFWFSHPGMG